MKTLFLAAMAILATAVAATAQTAPDLKGTWSGVWRTVIYGNNPHHSGSETVAQPPRVRDITFTLEVQGQDGRLLWGQSWSDPARKEPFAATIAADGKTIVGADTDGSLSGSIASADRLELCYAHAASSPSQSIVASCGGVTRSR
jgi:hypothetical protein